MPFALLSKPSSMHPQIPQGLGIYRQSKRYQIALSQVAPRPGERSEASKGEGAPMGGIARPRPSIVDSFKKHKVEGGRQYYFDPNEQRYYSWDSLHGEFEVFDKRGYHLGSVCPITGITLKPPVRGRRFNPN